MGNKLQFPVYIPTKGRSQYMITSKVLTGLGVPHFLVVEPQQCEAYREAVRSMNLSATVLELDMSYKEKYDLCDRLGLSKSTGSGPARNFAWDHSIAQGFAWHWIMDDNITSFRRLNKNEKVKVSTSKIFTVMEDFVLRYVNVSMAGPNYYMFAKGRDKLPPFITNTKLYSCNLIRNDVPFRWRGRYNEDVILSLDMLKSGWCTVQFNAFLQQKMPTQTIKGGNTDELYKGDTRKKGEKYAKTGTTDKSQMLARVHPDVTKVTWKFKRVHHVVDYSSFKKNRLIRRPDLQIPDEPNEYGMALRKLT